MPHSGVMKDDRLINSWSWAKQRTWWPSRCRVPQASKSCLLMRSSAHRAQPDFFGRKCSWVNCWCGVWESLCVEDICGAGPEDWQAKGAAKGVWLKGVNPSSILTVKKPKEKCPWLVFLCMGIPVWYRHVSKNDTWRLFLHVSIFCVSVLQHGGQIRFFSVG